jgi:hypothetical protein
MQNSIDKNIEFFKNASGNHYNNTTREIKETIVETDTLIAKFKFIYAGGEKPCVGAVVALAEAYSFHPALNFNEPSYGNV